MNTDPTAGVATDGATTHGCSVLSAALDYAARGCPVLPLHHPMSFGPREGPARATRSCRGDDCRSQGTHPRTLNGLKDASTDPAIVAAWWQRWPRANVGVLTGVLFDVLDICRRCSSRRFRSCRRPARRWSDVVGSRTDWQRSPVRSTPCVLLLRVPATTA